jgi:hypothetical protein
MTPIPPMSDQPQLPLLDPATAAERNVRWLESILKSRAAWSTSDQLLLLLGRDPTDDHKRQLRQLANASEWIISGQKGYKHLEHATAEEINHFCNWMESQAAQMTKRAENLRRNAHRIFG